MDGVIVNSVSYKHERRTRVIRDEFGLTRVDTDELIGLNSQDKYDYLVENAGLDIEKSEFLDQFDNNIERVYTDQVDLLPGFESTLEWLAERDVKAGLASASSRHRVELVMDRFGLNGALDAVASADDIAGESKPDPAIYLHVASSLGVDPSACAAVEDSEHGVTAAKNAGMYCLGYDPQNHPDQDLSRADEVATNPQELHSRLRTVVDGAETPSG